MLTIVKSAEFHLAGAEFLRNKEFRRREAKAKAANALIRRRSKRGLGQEKGLGLGLGLGQGGDDDTLLAHQAMVVQRTLEADDDEDDEEGEEEEDGVESTTEGGSDCQSETSTNSTKSYTSQVGYLLFSHPIVASPLIHFPSPALIWTPFSSPSHPPLIPLLSSSIPSSGS